MDLPYRVEYAKSGRAGCRKCKSKIDQGILRLAAMIQVIFENYFDSIEIHPFFSPKSYRHDGKDPQWFHFDCFFVKQRPKTVDEIEHFENISSDDQQRIRKKIEDSTGILLPETSKGKKGKKRAADSQANAAALKDFGIEYSVSSRAECVGCQNKIMKENIRVKKIVYDTEVGAKFGGQPLWHHLNCFVSIRGDYGFYLGGESLPGFENLSASDRKQVKKVLQ
jgi:poly [ADP-ribose] polymerase 1